MTTVLESVPAPRRRVLTRRRISWAGVILVIAAAAAALALVALTGEEGPSRQASGTAKPIAIEDANDFDPPPGDQDEHSEEVGLAVDGSPNTVWTTETYESVTLNNKPGVGLYLDAGESVSPTQLDIETPTPGWDLEVYGAAEGPPEALADWEGPIGLGTAAGREESVPLNPPVPFRYFLIWITSPAQTDDGYGAEIADARLLG